MPAMLLNLLKPLIAGIGSVVVRMVVTALSRNMIEQALLSGAELLLRKYERAARNTPQPDDDERAQHLRSFYTNWKAALHPEADK